MELSRIMLVDDEEEVRESIIKKINWNQLGYEMVGDAENGEEAYEMLESAEPDVVLTDIRMPYMDGLELAEKIYHFYPSVKIIFFSGYDDFEYAKKAIQLNVISYILKPVNAEELSETLTKIRNDIQKEITQKRDIEYLRHKLQISLPVIQEHFLDDLTHGRIKPDLINEQLKYYDIPIDNAKSWIAVTIGNNNLKEDLSKNILPFHKEQGLLYVSIKQLLEDSMKGLYSYACFHSAHGLSAVISLDENHTIDSLLEVLKDFYRKCKKILELSITIGIGNPRIRLDKINDSYRESIEAIGYKSIDKNYNVIYFHDVEPKSDIKSYYDSRLENELISTIKYGEPEDVLRNIKSITGQIIGRNFNVNQYQSYILHLINLFTELARRYEINVSCILGNDGDFIELFASLKSPDNLELWIRKISLIINENINTQRTDTIKALVRQSIKYISENYKDPDLSSEVICRQLHISTAYFSTIFKKETGKSYVTYLTDLRLDKAVELLNQTDDKSYVVAAKVGYLEPNYFSYVFKRKFGVSPSKYRGRQNNAEKI